MTPLISIIIPTYNRVQYVTRAIDAIRNQKFQAWELIVVDDGSSDDTAAAISEISRSDDRVRLIVQTNAGVSEARSTGIAAVRPSSEFLMFHDDDDWLTEDALIRLIELAKQHPNAPAVIGFARHCDSHGYSTETISTCFGSNRISVSPYGFISRPAIYEPERVSSLVVWCNIATPGQAVIRRSAFERTRGFLRECQPSDDWLLWLELASQGDIPRLCEFTLNKRDHLGAVNKNSSMMAGAEESVRRLWLNKPGITSTERIIAMQGYVISSLANASWALDDFRKGLVVSGIKQMYRMLKRILRIIFFWATVYRRHSVVPSV